MTAFIALVRKDLILFISDKRALLINLALPIVLAAFFGYLFGGSGESKAGKIELLLVQQDTSEVGKKIAAGLMADPALQVTPMALEEARTLVRKGKQKAAIVIPAGFGEAAGAALFGAGAKPEIGVLYDPSQTAVLSMVKGMLTQQVMQVVSADMFGGKSGQAFTDKSLAELEAQAGKDPDSAALRDLLGSVKKFQERSNQSAANAASASNASSASSASSAAAKGGLAMPFVTHDEALTSGSAVAGYNGYAHAFAGMSVQFILFMGINLGIDILLARRSGIWSRLLAAPITLSTVLVARAVSGALIALGLLTAIFGVAVLVFKVQVANPLGFIGVAVCFSVLTATFGLLIAAFGKTPEAARGLSTFATLIMVMLGGAWVPSFLFPQWVQTASLAVPTRWAIDGFDAMTWRGLGMDAALSSMAVQLAFALVFGALAIWKFRAEQK